MFKLILFCSPYDSITDFLFFDVEREDLEIIRLPLFGLNNIYGYIFFGDFIVLYWFSFFLSSGIEISSFLSCFDGVDGIMGSFGA